MIRSGQQQRRKGPTKSAWEALSPIGKVAHVLGTGERFGVRNALLPMMESATPDIFDELKQSGILEQDNLYAGDILNTLYPATDFGSKVGKFIGSMALGGLVDPGTYLLGGLGGLTRKGVTTPFLSRAGKSLAEQAKVGERALLHARLPFAGGAAAQGVPLIKGVPVFQAVDALKSGYLGEKLLGKTLLKEQAAKLDRYYRGISTRFGFDVGVHPFIAIRSRQMLSAIRGQSQVFDERAFAKLEPMFGELAAKTSEFTGMDPNKALTLWKDVVREYHESSAWVRPGVKAITTKQGNIKLVYKMLDKPMAARDRAIHIVANNFPTPPQWGGPGTAFESWATRELRKSRIDMQALIMETSRKGAYELSDYQKLMGDQSYFTHRVMPEVRTWLEKSQDKLPKRLAGYAAMPLTSQIYNVQRRMRLINRHYVERLIQEGKLPSVANVQVKIGGKLTTVERDLAEWAKKFHGRMPSTKFLNFLSAEAKTNPKFTYWDFGHVAPSLTIGQAEAYFARYGFANAPPGQFKQIFMHDPTVLVSLRNQSAVRAGQFQQLYREVSSRPDLAVLIDRNLINKRFKGSLPLWLQTAHPDKTHWQEIVDVPELRGILVEPEIVDFFRRKVTRDFDFSDSLNPFIKGFHNATSWFRSWVTSIFPVYQIRNFVSNMYRLFESTDSPQDYTQALDLSRQFWHAAWAKKPDTLIDLGSHGKMRVGDIWKELSNRNSLNIGFISADPKTLAAANKTRMRFGKIPIVGSAWEAHNPEVTVLREFRKRKAVESWGGRVVPPITKAEELKKLGMLHPDSWFVDLGFRVASQLDDVVRVGSVLNKMKNGMDIDGAVQHMKKNFFDYHDLTEFERQTMRSVFPFYTWSRKNLPLILETLVTSPSKYARFFSGVRGIQSSPVPEDEYKMQDWMLRNMPARVRKNTKTGKTEYFFFRNWLPAADLLDVFHIGNYVKTSLNPIPRVTAELLMNHSWYTGKEIDRFNSVLKGERVPYFRYKVKGGVPKKLAHVLDSFRVTNEIHKWMDNPNELDALARWANLFFGKLYPLDPDMSTYVIHRDFQEILSDYRRSAKFVDTEERKRLFQETMRRREKLLGRKEALQ